MTTRAIQIDFLLAGLVHPNTGEILSSGTVEFFEAGGTTTEKDVWTEREKTNNYTSFSLSSVGNVQLYGDGEYCVRVKDSTGAVVYTWDYIRLQYPQFKVRTISTTPATITTDDDLILLDTTSTAITLNMPSAADMDRPIEFERIAGTNSFTIDPYGSETINGASDLTINFDAAIRVISDGSNLLTVTIRSAFADADNDTKIQVEESPDEDKIRMDTAGVERVVIDSTGVTLTDDLIMSADEIKKSTSSSYLVLTGGVDSNNAGAVICYGSAHATPSLVTLWTGGLERVRVDASGNLGVGKTPGGSYKLDVLGNTYIDGTLTIINDLIVTSDEIKKPSNDGYLIITGGVDSTHGGAIVLHGDSYAEPNIIKFYTATQERMQIDASGRVGIAIAPEVGYNFKVSGSSKITGSLVLGGSITMSVGASIDEFSTDGTFAGNSDTASPTEKASKTYMDAHANSTGASHTYINQSVTTSATPFFAGLSSTGAITTTATITSGSSNDISQLANGVIELSKTTGALIDFKTAAAEDYDVRLVADTSNGLSFITGAGAATPLRLDASGRVGIDVVPEAGYNFKVSGSSRITGSLDVDTNINLTGNLVMVGTQIIKSVDSSYLVVAGGTTSNDGGAIILYGDSHGTPNIISFYTATQERMQIDASGRIGIAVAPEVGYNFKVAGTCKFTGAVYADTAIHATEKLVIPLDQPSLENGCIWLA